VITVAAVKGSSILVFSSRPRTARTAICYQDTIGRYDQKLVNICCISDIYWEGEIPEIEKGSVRGILGRETE
jgi:hypothetical protein